MDVCAGCDHAPAYHECVCSMNYHTGNSGGLSPSPFVAPFHAAVAAAHPITSLAAVDAAPFHEYAAARGGGCWGSCAAFLDSHDTQCFNQHIWFVTLHCIPSRDVMLMTARALHLDSNKPELPASLITGSCLSGGRRCTLGREGGHDVVGLAASRHCPVVMTHASCRSLHGCCSQLPCLEALAGWWRLQAAQSRRSAAGGRRRTPQCCNQRRIAVTPGL